MFFTFYIHFWPIYWLTLIGNGDSDDTVKDEPHKNKEGTYQ
jgi:hypothetical protein